MKLKDGFIYYENKNSHVLVSANGDFNGMAKCNKTAAFIIDCLKSDTTEELIVKKMLDIYDAPKERIKADVKTVIEKLKAINAIED